MENKFNPFLRIKILKGNLIGKQLAFVLMFAVLSTVSYSQVHSRQGRHHTGENKGPHPEGPLAALELSEEQKEKISDLRLNFQKNILDERNQVRELAAEYKTLMSGKNPDMGKVNENIEKRQELRTVIMKERASLQAEVRALLTEEQIIKLDSGYGRHAMKARKGQGRF